MFSKFLRIALTLIPLMVLPLQAQPSQGSNPRGNSQQAGKIQWFTNYSQGVAAAKQQNKPILLFFTGSDWCGWCKKMESEIFNSADFAQAAGNRFVFVELDFPMNTKQPDDLAAQNAALKKKYSITGFPTVVILDPNENFIAETGYQAGGGKAYADYLNELSK